MMAGQLPRSLRRVRPTGLRRDHIAEGLDRLFSESAIFMRQRRMPHDESPASPETIVSLRARYPDGVALSDRPIIG